MPITMKLEGMDGITKALDELGARGQSIASKGLYEGAGVIADEVKKGAEKIKTAPFHYAVFVTRDPSPEEKQIVMDADAGIAKFKKTGSEVNTSVGYRNAGYAMLNGRRKPIPVIVNAINSGTSFMRKQPFFRQATSRGKTKAEEAIKEKIEAELEAITK